MIPAIIAGGVAAANIATNLYNSYKDREARRDARQRLCNAQTKADSDY